jgi:hypothetical protein
MPALDRLVADGLPGSVEVCMRPSTVITSALLLLALCPAAEAWTRPLLEDAEIVRRAEFIAVGHVKPGSITFIPKPDGGRGGSEHGATLVVTEVLKGTSAGKEIPILFHYGLTPVIGGRIFDTGSLISSEPVVADARQDHIWLLRKSNGPFEHGAVAADLGITDPQEVRPLALKAYLKAHLARDTERAMKALLTGPAVTARPARYFLELQEVRRISCVPDRRERAEKLPSYFREVDPWAGWSDTGGLQERILQHEVHKALLACGPAAGPALRRLFRDSATSERRKDIIDLWGEVRYAGAAPILADLLAEYDRFWAAQKLGADWWTEDGCERRREVTHETVYAVRALGRIGGPRARAAIEQTRRRWQGIKVQPPERGGPPSVAEECEYALKHLHPSVP